MWYFKYCNKYNQTSVSFILLQDSISIKIIKLNPGTTKIIPLWFVKVYTSQNYIFTSLNTLVDGFVDFDDTSFVINLHIPNMSILINFIFLKILCFMKEQQKNCVFIWSYHKRIKIPLMTSWKKKKIVFFHK